MRRERSWVGWIFFICPNSFTCEIAFVVGGREKMIEVLKKCFTFFYGLLCLVGCLYQIKSVTDGYFNYLMTTKVKIELPSQMNPPALNICLRYIEVFEWARYMNATGLVRGNMTDEQMSKLLTVDDIFRFTPSNKKDLLMRCIYRNRDSYNFHQEEGQVCHDHFNVTNFFMQDYICYRIKFKGGANSSLKYSYNVPAFALTYPNLLYSVSIDKNKFGRAEYVKVIINDRGQHPFRSASFAPLIKRFTSNHSDLDARYNYFTATYFTVTSSLLPPPFATKCKRYEDFNLVDKEDCIKQCLIKACTEKLDRYPYSILEQNKANFKIIHESDIETNVTLKKLYYRLELSCNHKCQPVDCNSNYAITYVTRDPQVLWITFNVLIPQYPWYEVAYSPRTKFIEYFIYVLSCFGIWFGLSFLSLNPFRIQWITMFSRMKKNSFLWKSGGQISFDRHKKLNFMARTQEYQDNICDYCMQSKLILINEINEKLNYLDNLVASRSVTRE